MFDLSNIAAFGVTDKGMRRPLNEDAWLVDMSGRCLVVADGVGGAAAGEVASSLFVSAATEVIRHVDYLSEQNAVNAVQNTFLQANTAILTHATEHPGSSGMACTAEMFLFFDEGFVLGHVGDSRTYRFRDNELKRLTRDHSFVQQQLESGKITEHEAQCHRYRNVILRAVGTEESIDVDIIRGRVKPGDIFLLCSDGLTDMVQEREIASCLQRDQDLDVKVRNLVVLANEKGGKDNITVILALVSS